MRQRWIAAALAILLILVGVVAWQRYSEVTAWERAQAIPVAGMQPGTVMQANGLFVARQPDGDYRVFLTWSGFYGAQRPVVWDAGLGKFVEPISGAENLLDGTPLFGPAGDLYRVEAQLRGDMLLVRRDVVISGGPRGDPVWLERLKTWFRRTDPHVPLPPTLPPIPQRTAP